MAADRRFKIFAVADGFGQLLKDVVVAYLRTHPAVADVLDLGVDKYYAAAASVASNVVKTSSSDAEYALEARGIVVCGTGAGVAIFANKYPGVYATHCAVPAVEQAVPGEEAGASEYSVSGVPAGGGGKEEEGTGVPDGAAPVRGWHRRGGGHSDEGALVRGRPGQCGTYSLGADVAGERECRGPTRLSPTVAMVVEEERGVLVERDLLRKLLEIILPLPRAMRLVGSTDHSPCRVHPHQRCTCSHLTLESCSTAARVVISI
ncbi:hypothetical protein ABZP36_032435 [Zizania latifolia]